jgi:hypothetical protein
MASFKQFLNEFLDRKIEINWEEEDGAQLAKFHTGEHNYQVEFTQKANKVDWEVKFALVTFFGTRRAEELKTGSEFVVFSGVVTAVKEFLEQKKPKVLYFAADDKEQFFKDKFYVTLLKRFEKDLKEVGYAVTEEKLNTIHKYVMKRIAK